MHNLFLRIKNQLSVLRTHDTPPTTPPAIIKNQQQNPSTPVLDSTRHRSNSSPGMDLQRSRSLKSIRVRKISKGSLKSLRRGTVCVTVSTHASSVFYDKDTEVIEI